IRDSDGSERTVELRDGVMRIGRGPDNEIILGDAGKGVSRSHAELHVEKGRCTIVDLHNQNGTWVNALRVQRAEQPPDPEIASAGRGGSGGGGRPPGCRWPGCSRTENR